MTAFSPYSVGARPSKRWQTRLSRVYFHWAGLVLAAGLCSLAGCGEGGLEPSDRAPVSPPGIAPTDMMGGEVPPAAAPSGPPADAADPAMAPMPADPAAAGGPSAPPVQAAKPAKTEPAEPLPEKIADWKKDDYLRARIIGDKRLAEAAMHLGERFAGTAQADSAAQLLVMLLKPLTPEEKAQRAAAARPPVQPSPEMSGEPGMSEDPTMADTGMDPAMADMSGMEPSMDDMSSMDPSMGYGQPPGGADSALIKAIVYALGATRSNAGRSVLKQVLAGTCEVENDPVAASAALESLAFYQSPENEAILLEVIATPEKIRKVEKPAEKEPEPKPAETRPGQPARPPGFESVAPPTQMSAEPAMDVAMSGEPMYGQQGQGARVSPSELQKRAIALVQRKASEDLRTKIAAALANKAVPETVRAEVGKFLLEKRPDNAPAQMLFYRNDVLDPQSKEAVVGYFTSYSSDALGAMMGIPPGVKVELPTRQAMPGMGTEMSGMEPSMPMEASAPEPELSEPSGMDMSADPGSGMPGMEFAHPGQAKPEIIEIDAKLGYRIASQLWSADFARVVTERLDAIESLANGAPRIAMASTMPLDEMRARLYTLLEKHALEGPAAVESSGLLNDVIFEPGFLAVVKSLPREDPPVGRKPAEVAPKRTSRRSRTPAGDQQGGGGNETPEWQQRQQASYAWMRTSEYLVRALCGRLAAAGESQFGLGDAKPQQPPLEVATDAEITSQFSFEWPTEAAKQLAGSGVPLDPMKLQYVRLKQVGKPKSILGFYRRKMNQPVVHEMGHECWAESFRNLPKSDRKLNVDLFVTVPQLAPAQGQPNQFQPDAPQQPGGFTLGGTQPAESDETEVIVEILSLEIKDPAPPKEKK